MARLSVRYANAQFDAYGVTDNRGTAMCLGFFLLDAMEMVNREIREVKEFREFREFNEFRVSRECLL